MWCDKCDTEITPGEIWAESIPGVPYHSRPEDCIKHLRAKVQSQARYIAKHSDAVNAAYSLKRWLGKD